MLRLELLGPPTVSLEGRVVKLGVKQVSILAYLALEGRSSRRLLGSLLWPEAPNALNNISVARNQLEKMLGKTALGKTALGKTVLETDLETLALTPGFECDVFEFRAGAAKLEPQAWALWRGGFLTGLRLQDWEMGLGAEFEEWLYATRESLNLERRSFAAGLARQQLQADRLEAALEFLEVAQSSDGDPNEDATRWLILVFGALGRVNDASTVFAKLASVLRQDLGVEPTLATIQVLELVRNENPQACRAMLEKLVGTTQPASAESESESKGVTSEHVPFVGRAALLERLLQSLQFRANSGRALLLQGEPGAGKSRLAQEIARALGPQPVLELRTVASLGSLPGSALDTLARQRIPECAQVLEAIPSEWRDALARFVPDLLHTRGESGTPELEQRALFAALRRLLETDLACVVIFDDLQWADQSSLDFLHFLLEHPLRHGLALIMTQRNTEDAIANANLIQARLARDGSGLSIALEPLAFEAINELAMAFTYAGDTQELTVRCGGNPFYALELLRSEGEQQQPASDRASDRISDLVRYRLGQLGETERQTLDALAVAGNNSKLSVVRRIAGRSLEETSIAIQTLERVALLQLEGNDLRFAHDIVREVVQSDLNGLRSNLLHLRAARARKGTVGLAATHYWQSREAWDETETVHDALDASNEFLEAAKNLGLRGNLEAALEWFARANSTASNSTASNSTVPNSKFKTLVRIEQASTLERYGQHQQALNLLEVAEAGLEDNDPILQARILVARGLILERVYRQLENAKLVFEAALKSLEGLQGTSAQAVRSDVLNMLGLVAYDQQDYLGALAMYKQAQALRRALEDTPRIAETLGAMGLAATALKQTQGEAYLQECLELRQQIGDVNGQGRALSNLAHHYNTMGDPVRALEFQERSLQIQERIGNPVDIAITLNNIGVYKFEQQDFTAAKQHYQRALETLERHQLPARDDYLENLAEVNTILKQTILKQTILEQADS